MDPREQDSQISSGLSLADERAQSVSRFMNRVYRWMILGILVTAVTAIVTNYYMFDVMWYFRHQDNGVQQFKWVFYGLLILQLVLVIGLSAFINRMSQWAATFCYLFYAFTVGLTTSFIFYVFTRSDISSAFFITVVAFAGLTAFGYFTKRDLKFIGTFCMMGLFGLIGIFIYAMFVPSFMTDNMQFYSGIIGVVIFSGLTAYDSQKIRRLGIALMQQKNVNPSGSQSTDIQKIENQKFSSTADIATQKAAIIGALILYLDFINLFLSLLRVMKK